MPVNIQIEGGDITDWDSFHDCFAKKLGFPKFYGRNLNAWIDCMTCLDDAESGMTSVHLSPGDVLVICISGMANLKMRLPEIHDALVECSAFVNWRRIEEGQPAILALSFYE